MYMYFEGRENDEANMLSFPHLGNLGEKYWNFFCAILATFPLVRGCFKTEFKNACLCVYIPACMRSRMVQCLGNAGLEPGFLGPKPAAVFVNYNQSESE